ncbi:uncharacterized protein LOC100904239 [Galendromus occidentalis]|uniref:Uncharacterized protein LOC100904239 n=1 Tax=Galendromus occidentalis TaxID=34638 RepID=A0AAJ6QWK8_9ACAR|nr:uncharacterized protein LOC100904239 [Galendromus occidentalis]
MSAAPVVMTSTEDEKTDEFGISEKIFFKEGSRIQDAEVLLASLEEYITRRFDPKPTGFMSKGLFQLKLDELRSKIDVLESSSQDPDFLWICEKITLLINLCRNLEGAVRSKSERVSAGEGVGACNDTDHLLDCLRLEMRQRGEETAILKPVTRRLTKIKAHYLSELTGDWRQQVRWQKSEFPRTRKLTISSEAGKTFALLNGLRNSSTLTTELLECFVENIVRPVVNDQCLITCSENTSLVQLEVIMVEKAEEAKVNPLENLQTVYTFISKTILPLFSLQENSREIAAMLNLLGQRAREENPEAIDDLATNIHSNLPQTANLLTGYATEAEGSKEALQIVSEMEEMMLTALEPTEEAEISHIPNNLMRVYVVSSWVPSLADSILRLKHESVLLPVFSCLLRHLSACEAEALCSPFKVAVFLNNCFYLANRCSLHCSVATNSIIMLKEKGTSVFLRFINEHRMNEISMSSPVSSSLKLFLAYMSSLQEMEAFWKRSLPFENYSKAMGLLFNSLSTSLESYIFQQKFLTENEVVHLKSLLLRAISMADAWQRGNENTLHVSAARASNLLQLMQMTPEDISLSWKSQSGSLRTIFTADQVSSLAKARFTLEEFDKLHAVLF